jgi:hypothetical protein
MASAVGAACVEAGSVLQGVGAWDDLLERINAGWATQSLTLMAEKWRKDEENDLWEKS